MKKYTAILMIILMVFSAGAAVYADEADQQIVTVNPFEILTDPTFDLNTVDPAQLEVFYATEVNIPDAYLKTALQNLLNLSSDSAITVENMFSLTGSLNLAGMSISNLTGLEYAINVTSISLGNNSVTSLEPLKNLYKLKNLDYSNNNVKAVPSWIFDMQSLESVNGSANGSTVFSSGPSAENTVLKSMYFENNKFTSVPDLSLCTSLEILSLSNNEFTQFPSNLLSLTKLQMLNLANNEISTVPDLSALTSLNTINFDGNNLTEFPSGLEKLSSLQQISVSGNQITQIPDSISSNSSLQILLISMNNIETLPESLSNSSSLKVLDISLNNIDLNENANVINALSRKLSTFYYKLQKPSFTLEIYQDKEAPLGKLVWSGIENITDKTEGTLTITGFTIERIENAVTQESDNQEDNTPVVPSVYVPIAEVGPDVREYIDETADPDKSYTYRVTANVTGLYLNETEYTASGSETVSTDDIIKGEPNWLRSWWFYTIIGVVVAAIVAFAIILLLKKQRKNIK